MEAGTDEGGVTRRSFLRRGAVLGGSLVWATPVVMDFGNISAAWGSEGDPLPAWSGSSDPGSAVGAQVQNPPPAQVMASTLGTSGSTAPTAATQAAQVEILPETGVAADTMGAVAAGLIGLGAVAAHQARSAERRAGDGPDER